MKYAAFISYSHKDAKWAKRLQDRLEAFRVPKGLSASLGPGFKALRPVFRDRAELPSSGSLSAAMTAALQESHSRVVICSPSAARSRWVNEELRLFKEIG